MSVTIPTLETERLILRAFRDADHDDVADFFANDAGAAYVGGPLDRRLSWRLIATFLGHWQLRGFGPFALQRKDNGTWIGFCNLWRPPEFPENEIGWALREADRGHGFVNEAAQRVRAYAFETLRWPTLVSYIMADNGPSQRVAERLGAICEGDVVIRDTAVGVWRHPRPGGS
jgi:RimJ/RimL family protein N-acetyltransferase